MQSYVTTTDWLTSLVMTTSTSWLLCYMMTDFFIKNFTLLTVATTTASYLPASWRRSTFTTTVPTKLPFASFFLPIGFGTFPLLSSVFLRLSYLKYFYNYFIHFTHFSLESFTNLIQNSCFVLSLFLRLFFQKKRKSYMYVVTYSVTNQNWISGSRTSSLLCLYLSFGNQLHYITLKQILYVRTVSYYY